MLPAIVDCAEQVIDRMKQVSQRGVLREMLLREEMNCYTLQVIGKVRKVKNLANFVFVRLSVCVLFCSMFFSATVRN